MILSTVHVQLYSVVGKYMYTSVRLDLPYYVADVLCSLPLIYIYIYIYIYSPSPP